MIHGSFLRHFWGTDLHSDNWKQKVGRKGQGPWSTTWGVAIGSGVGIAQNSCSLTLSFSRMYFHRKQSLKVCGQGCLWETHFEKKEAYGGRKELRSSDRKRNHSKSFKRFLTKRSNQTTVALKHKLGQEEHKRAHCNLWALVFPGHQDVCEYMYWCIHVMLLH